MSADLLTLQQRQYISVQGEHSHFKMDCKGLIPPGLSNIYLTTLLKPKSDGFATQPNRCKKQSYIHCLKFFKKGVIYYVHGNLTGYYYSWLMANEFCRNRHMELPFFLSRSELDDFTRYVQRSNLIPWSEAIFIGLRYNENKVCSIILFPRG